MFPTPTGSSGRGEAHPASPTASSLQPLSGLAGQEVAEEVRPTRQAGDKSKSMSFASEEYVLHKLGELFEGVKDSNERLHLISKAIEHLQGMQAKIMKAK